MTVDWTKTLDGLKTTFGESVSYTPPTGGTASTLTVCWKEAEPQITPGETGQTEEDTERCVIAAADLATPERDATITRTLTGETWVVEKVKALRGAAFELTVRRSETIERTAGKYRQQ